MAETFETSSMPDNQAPAAEAYDPGEVDASNASWYGADPTGAGDGHGPLRGRDIQGEPGYEGPAGGDTSTFDDTSDTEWA